MSRLHSAAARHPSTACAIELLDRAVPRDARSASLVFAFYGCGHDDAALHGYLSERFPGAAIVGGSSAGGLITDQGFIDEHGIGLLIVDDAAGSYAAAAGPLGDDPATAAQALLQRALAACDSAGELPELIWIYQAPGHEEAVIEGLRRMVGDRCPIVGGSAADNDVSGRWRQIGPEGVFADGLVVAVLFPSAPLGSAFQGGYEPSGPNGVITGMGYTAAGASGVVTSTSGRAILGIDGEPAAQVYNRWLGGRLDRQLRDGGTVLADTTMQPVATDAGRIDGVNSYLLVHPESVGRDGELRTFRNLAVGDRIYAMHGDRKRLIDRAGRVARQAHKALPTAPLAGGVVVYCGGCKMAVGADIAHVAASLGDAFGSAPYIACFTFGEQGRLAGRNVHGNLMISAVGFAGGQDATT